jgi:hypothetical protein
MTFVCIAAPYQLLMFKNYLTNKSFKQILTIKP